MMEDNNSSLPGILLGELLSLNIDLNLIGNAGSNQIKSLEQFPKTLIDVTYFISQYMPRVTSHDIKIGLMIAVEIPYKRFIKKTLQSAREINQFLEGIFTICSKSCTSDFES